MGPGYFVIAIMGCADGGSMCTPVATLHTHYASESECSTATPAALEANSNFDFPTLMAQCRPGSVPASAQVRPERRVPQDARRS